MRSAWAVAALVGGLVACGFYDAVPSPSSPFVPDLGLPDAGLPNLPDGGFQLPDGGYALPDGGFALPDGGFQLPDGGFQLPDGGYGLPDGGFGQVPACPPTTCVPEVFISGQGSPQGVAVSAERVYWTDPQSAALSAMRKDGRTREVLYSGALEPALRVDGSRVYVVRPWFVTPATTHSLAEVNTPAASLATWPAQALRPGALAQNLTTLFVDTRQGLVQALKDGWGSRVRLGSAGQRAGLAADEQGAYFSYRDSGQLMRVDPSFESDRVDGIANAPAGTRVEVLHVSAGTLYAAVTLAPDGYCNRGASLLRVPTAGGAFASVSTSPGCVVDLASDAQHLYWLASVPGQGTLLLRAPQGGGDAWQLAKLQADSPSLAVDDTHVYWTEPALGRVMRMAKP
jgi:hypothetical protein